MVPETYCSNNAEELADWRAKLDRIVKKFDEASCCDKEKLVSQLNDLHIMKNELDERIKRLETECLEGSEFLVTPLP